MISTVRLFLVLTAVGGIFSTPVSAFQEGTNDSSQLVVTLRAPNDAETTTIADPLDVQHALALYRALIDPNCGSVRPCKEYPTYIIVNVVHWEITTTRNSAASASPASNWYLIHPASDR